MDSLKIFAGMNAKKLTEQTCEKIGDIEPASHEIQQFPQDAFRVKLGSSVAEKDTYIVQSLYPNPHEALMELRQIAWTLNCRRADKVTAIFTFDPYLRSDREDEARVCITASMNAFLNRTAGIGRVAIVAPHFSQIAGYYGRDPCYLIKTVDLLAERIQELDLDLSDACVVAPDDNRTEDAREVARFLGEELIHNIVILSKERATPQRTKINHMIGTPKPLCIIIDDEVLSGGTIKAAIAFLKEHGGTTFVPVFTHYLSHKSAVEFFEQEKSVPKVITTNTIPLEIALLQQSTKLSHISIAKRLSKIIDGLHFGKDIDEHLIIEKEN